VYTRRNEIRTRKRLKEKKTDATRETRNENMFMHMHSLTQGTIAVCRVLGAKTRARAEIKSRKTNRKGTCGVLVRNLEGRKEIAVVETVYGVRFGFRKNM